MAPSSLSAALNTACSIILSYCSCPSYPKSMSSNDSPLSAIDDKTSNARVESALVSPTVWIVSIIKPTLSASDFANILPMTAMLLFSSSVSFNIWVNIFSLMALLASTLDVVRNVLSSLDKLVITLATK